MTCVDCGKEITGAATRLRCEECNYARKLMADAKRRAEARDREREGREKEPPKIKYCIDCGVQLPVGCCVRTQRCTECRVKRKKETNRLYQKKRNAAKQAEEKRRTSLGAVAREAAAHGMSYGQWVAAGRPT